MSRARKIPSTSNPWVCVINNTVYSYEAGKTLSVPDEVAEVIDTVNAFPPAAPATAKPFELKAATKSVAGVVKQGAAVANAAAAPTMAEFNALLTSLRNAGIIASS